MVLIEIPDNPNCDPVDTRVFHGVSPPRSITQVRLELVPGEPAWYDVTGWMPEGAPCPATAQKVDDSGEGIAWLVRGGDAGLRLKLAALPAAWDLRAPAQWGEPFLLLSTEEDVHWQSDHHDMVR